MKIKEQKAKEYCEKNIPSLPQMHLTVSTAFEAGWEAAMDYLSQLPWDKAVDEICDYVNSKDDGKD